MTPAAAYRFVGIHSPRNDFAACYVEFFSIHLFMKFSDLIAGLNPESTRGKLGADISGLAYDSRKVKAGDLFLAMRGQKTDGHKYLGQAVKAGAAGILLEEYPEETEIPEEVAVAQFQSVRETTPLVASRFYENPSRRMKVIGVTGTNGKTTTAWLVKHLCDASLQRAGYLGTIGYYIGDEKHDADRTTPESPDLQAMLADMVDGGCRAAALEVSSHAIHQHRSGGIDYAVMIFTNLSQDHLDYHGTMENYFAAKAQAFHDLALQKGKTPVALINADDAYGKRLIRDLQNRPGSKMKIQTFGMSLEADFRAENPRITRDGIQFALNALGRGYLVRSPLIGRFNMFNALAALGAVHGLGVDMRTAVKAMENIPQVPGRMEAVPARESFNVFVDYAHTDDALLNVLKTCKDLPHNNLRVVFGCGGDRDKAKRPKMARAVEQYADQAYVTSDNPRTEDPQAIIEDILKGFRRGGYTVEPDRRQAIFRAIDEARPGDIVMIAGKGHETYQELADGRIDFNDMEVAEIGLMERHRRVNDDMRSERMASREEPRRSRRRPPREEEPEREDPGAEEPQNGYDPLSDEPEIT
jgi:UDP-N-acetylmuramoyl-L-alanyl-D-glutamate--2,6-diaminopimelate ligase